MKIDISTLNRTILNIALQEEIDRQILNQNLIKRQIRDGDRFDGDEDLIAEIDRLKVSFGILQIRQKPVFDITNEELIFLEKMIANQTIASNGRLAEWSVNGSMTNFLKKKYFNENPNANEETFEKVRLDMVKYDLDLKECMKELANIINVDYNPDLKL